MTALLGKHVDAIFCPSSLGQVGAGAVRILAVADYERSKFAPDIRTFKEFGYSVALPGWYSFCVPKNTSKKIVDILTNAMQEVFKRHEKEISEGLLKLENVPRFLDSQESSREAKRSYETAFKYAEEMGVLAK